ncbi:MAG: type I-U CRISPR-associated protein Csx17 [Bryobacteraceae bacterium]|nr:type I-U CRISPR-associated protein Csx17 [Bryobacteraceae bacterium]
MAIVELRGCRPEPLSGYLKALAVFRLVSTQVDPQAKGCWQGECFCLDSTLDSDSLLKFFLSTYSPTPLIAPWNGGSGFYPGDRRDGIDAILQTQEPRFDDYRQTIRLVQGFGELPRTDGMLLGDMLEVAIGGAKKDEEREDWISLKNSLDDTNVFPPLRQLTADEFTKYVNKLAKGSPELTSAKAQAKSIKKLVTKVKKTGGGSKAEIVRACRNRLGDRAVEWLDAAAVVRADGDLGYPPILGTGGNEGRLDYTNNFMLRLSELLITPAKHSATLLRSALYGAASDGYVDASTGQFDPGRAGGFNQGTGVESSTMVNPWDQVLTLEGAAGWAGGVSRRQRVNSPRLAVSPFTVSCSSVGYGSAADSDTSGARAEVWMPLWSRPLAFSEFRSLLKEGRADVGKNLAASGLQFAQAVASLSVDRGIREFARFSLLKRRGDSYVALPSGRIQVDFAEAADLIQELTPLLDHCARLTEPPPRLTSAKHALERTIFEYLTSKAPGRLTSVLQAFGRLVQQLDFDFGRLRIRLSAGWLDHLGSSSEFRIAAALASLRSIDGIFSYSYLQRSSPHHAWVGRDLSHRMACVASRRLMEAGRAGVPGHAFAPSPVRAPQKPLSLAPEEVTAFLLGRCNEGQIEDLLFACTQFDWSHVQAPRGWERTSRVGILPRDWALLKCLFFGDPLYPAPGQPSVSVRAEPTIIPLLLAGRVEDACAIAQRRLRASGLSPYRVTFSDSRHGARLAAALLIPVTQRRLLNAVLAPQEKVS